MIAVALLAAALAQLISLPSNFGTAPYLGVVAIGLMGLALTGAFATLAADTDGTWRFILTTGLLNLLGYLGSRTLGVPLDHGLFVGWFHPIGMTIAFCGAVAAGLAAWTLIGRRHDASSSGLPVTSAKERELRLHYKPVARPTRTPAKPRDRVSA